MRRDLGAFLARWLERKQRIRPTTGGVASRAISNPESPLSGLLDFADPRPEERGSLGLELGLGQRAAVTQQRQPLQLTGKRRRQ